MREVYAYAIKKQIKTPPCFGSHFLDGTYFKAVNHVFLLSMKIMVWNMGKNNELEADLNG